LLDRRLEPARRSTRRIAREPSAGVAATIRSRTPKARPFVGVVTSTAARCKVQRAISFVFASSSRRHDARRVRYMLEVEAPIRAARARSREACGLDEDLRATADEDRAIAVAWTYR